MRYLKTLNVKRKTFCLGNVLLIDKKKVVGFHMVVLNIPGVLEKLTDIFYSFNLNIVGIAFSSSIKREEETGLFIAADFGGSNISPVDLKSKIKSIREIKDIKIIKPIAGILIDPYFYPIESAGTRAILLGRANVMGLMKIFRERYGTEVARMVFYNVGYQVGKEVYKIYFKGKEISLEEILKLLENILVGFGWGYVETKLKGNFIIIKINEYWECEAVKGEYKTSQGHLMRGILTGLFGLITRKEVKVEETKCIAKGDNYCQFEVNLGK